MLACLLLLLTPWTLAEDEVTADPPAVDIRDEGPLHFEDVPELDTAIVDRLQRYAELRSAGFRGFVDGGGVLISTRFGDTSQVHRVAQPGGARRQLTFDREPIASVQAHPNDPHQLLLRQDIGGNEAYQIVAFDTRTSRSTLLTDGTSRHGGALWSDDPAQPHAFLFTSTARNQKDYDILLGDTRKPGKGTPLFEGEGYHYVADWDPTANTILVGKYESSTRSSLYALEGGTLRRLTPEGEVSASGGVLSPDATTAYLVSDHEGEFKQLYALDVASGSLERLPVNLPWDVEGMALSADGRTLAFVVNERGWARLYALDLKKGAVRSFDSVPNGMVGRVQFDRDNPRILGMSISGPDRPSDAWTLDVKKDRATRWTESETAGLASADFAAPETVTWESFDGVKLDALLYTPDGPGPHPVVVTIHGGPEGQVRPYLSGLTQLLVAEGIAVVAPNVRGSRGYGKSFIKLDNAEKREDSVKDIGTLLTWIDARPELDAERVAVRGGSYGGYMVLASMVHFNDRLVGGIDVVGISSFVTFLENTKAYRRDLRRVEYGDERDPEMRALLEKISPLNNVDQIQDRLFVIHGANDPRVPVGEAEQIVKAVRSNGQTVWYLRAENEGHGFRKKANRDVSTALQVQFLRDLLLP